jgi:calcium-dependent protein kinase
MADWQGCGTLSEADVAAMIRAMMRAVQHCHDCGVLYLDVKPQNFLWEEKGGGGDLKLTDFGLAVLWNPSVMSPCDSRCN